MALQFRPYPVKQKRDKWGEINESLQNVFQLVAQAMQYSDDKKARELKEKRAQEGEAFKLDERREKFKKWRHSATMRPLEIEHKQAQIDKARRTGFPRPEEDPYAKIRRQSFESGLKKFQGATDPMKKEEVFFNLAPRAMGSGYIPVATMEEQVAPWYAPWRGRSMQPTGGQFVPTPRTLGGSPTPSTRPMSQSTGGTPSFNTVEQAEAANLPPGTIVLIGGRRARIR